MDNDARYEAERRRLVDQVRAKGIRDERVLAVLARVPRHQFVDAARLAYAYEDDALPIAEGQTISQPFTVAYQTEWLQVGPGDRVLEIGTGSGYQAAVLVALGCEVYSIERHGPLQAQALQLLAALHYPLQLKLGDGTLGWPEAAPFDGILVTAAGPRVPEALLAQLRLPEEGRGGGRLVIPLGDPEHAQVMTRFTRRGRDEYEREEGDVFRFVPLVSESDA